MSEQEPRAGDHVRHEPSGEEWVVAHVSNGMLAWCGWPAGMVKLSECRVRRRCSDAEHLALVNKIATMGDGDFRASHAQRYLRERAMSN